MRGSRSLFAPDRAHDDCRPGPVSEGTEEQTQPHDAHHRREPTVKCRGAVEHIFQSRKAHPGRGPQDDAIHLKFEVPVFAPQEPQHRCHLGKLFDGADHQRGNEAPAPIFLGSSVTSRTSAMGTPSSAPSMKVQTIVRQRGGTN